jgi:hypothetical protein
MPTHIRAGNISLARQILNAVRNWRLQIWCRILKCPLRLCPNESLPLRKSEPKSLLEFEME